MADVLLTICLQQPAEGECCALRLLVWTSERSLLVVLNMAGCKNYIPEHGDDYASDWVVELNLKEGVNRGRATPATISCADNSPFCLLFLSPCKAIVCSSYLPVKP